MGNRLKRFLPALLIGAGLALGSAGAQAAGDALADRGPKIGTVIPHMLKSVDHRNQNQDFKSLARKRGLVILFSRSLSW